jgi:hypothetical protein
VLLLLVMVVVLLVQQGLMSSSQQVALPLLLLLLLLLLTPKIFNNCTPWMLMYQMPLLLLVLLSLQTGKQHWLLLRVVVAAPRTMTASSMRGLQSSSSRRMMRGRGPRKVWM